MADGFERVCAVRDLAPGALKAFVLADGTPLCLGNRQGTIFAVYDRCPHQQFPISEGELNPDGTLVCAWHGAAFECATGRAVRGPIRGKGEREAPLGRLRVYDVRVEHDNVLVRARDPGFLQDSPLRAIPEAG